MSQKYTFGKNGMLKVNGPGRITKKKRKAAFDRKIKARKARIEADPERHERERQARVAQYLAKHGTPTGLV